MTEPQPQADPFADEEAELDRLLARARPLADEARELHDLHAAIAVERYEKARGVDDEALAAAAFDKWQRVHRFIHARPFRLAPGLSRPEQWQQAAQRCAPIGDDELDQWLALQAEIAVNRQQGNPDYRIRRDGPVYLILLEYVGNRKRTALAVLHWAQAAGGEV